VEALRIAGEEARAEVVRMAEAEADRRVAAVVRHTAVEAVGREKRKGAGAGDSRLAEEADTAVGRSHGEVVVEEHAGRTGAVHPGEDNGPVEAETGNILLVEEEDVVDDRSFEEGEAGRMEVDNRPGEGMAAPVRSLEVEAAAHKGAAARSQNKTFDSRDTAVLGESYTISRYVLQAV
jgi:hypothetical protein